jgi:hypothetical protein
MPLPDRASYIERHVLYTYYDGSGMPKFMAIIIQKWDTGFSDGILEL